MSIIDISVPIDSTLPRWPGTRRPSLTKISEVNGKGASNETWMEMSPHTGTHIDAPLHFLEGASAVEKIPLDACIGEVLVVHLPKATEIGARELAAAKIPKGVTRILFKTSNEKRWKSGAFDKHFVGITAEGAEWLLKRKIKLVGVDYLSVAAYAHVLAVHEALLKKKVVLLEGITLAKAKAGRYTLVCAPLNLVGAEAAPVRAFLLR